MKDLKTVLNVKYKINEINNKKCQKLGFEDVRDLINKFGNWCYMRDFTYQKIPTTVNAMFNKFLKEEIEENAA